MSPDGAAPPGIQWEHQASEFLDSLVDIDIGYLDVQLAIEWLVHRSLLDDVSTSFVLDNRTVYMLRFPRRDLTGPAVTFDLYLFWTRERHGLIRVIHVSFAD